MRKTVLLAAAACLLAIAPASAAGDRIYSLFDFGYANTSVDSSSNDFSINQLHGSGSLLWNLEDNWNAQGTLSFATNRFADTGPNVAVDNWKLGGTAFYRDQAEGYLGGEIAYQSLDVLAYADGLSLTGRGEAYLDTANVGGYLGYTNLSTDAADIDTHGWQMGAYGKYYTSPSLGLKLALDYASYKVDTSDLTDLSLTGEAEYLLADSNTSLYADLGIGSMDLDGPDADYWQLGLGVRVHLGTGGSLKERNRTEPLQSIQTLRVIP
jgi:hypothetical protein